MRTFLTKLLFKLPPSILIRWSGKEQIEKGYRKLDPGFQYLIKIMENIGAKLDTSKPAAELRKEFEERRGLLLLPLPSGVKTTDHIIKSNSAQYSTEKLGHETLNINDYSHVTSPLRRMVDLMNQEIYYTKRSSLLQKIPIEKINNFNKGLKKAYRDIDKLYLSHLVYNNGYNKTKCYIYDFNIEKNKMYLYFPDKKLSIRNKIVSYKIKDKFTVYSENNNLIIVNNENQNKKILPINKLIDVEVNGKPNIYNVDRSIYIKYLI